MKLYFAQLKATQFPVSYESNSYKQFWRPTCCAKDSQEYQKPRFNLVETGSKLFDKWKLGDIKANDVQEKLSGWLMKTQKFVNDVATPLVTTSQARKSVPEDAVDDSSMEDIMVADQTIGSNTPQGILSIAAIVSIEQFSRMNGLTANRMQKVFKALVPEPIHEDARNLIEYCCFRFLSRDSSAVHPSLKEPSFQKLVFITMVAWEKPYSDEPYNTSAKASLQGVLVHEEAFIRIAPAISGVADQPTAHSLFKALAGEEEGISLAVWLTYIKELLRVHERRRAYQVEKFPELSERILCIGSNQKQPILKWEKNKAWPGKLTLTDRAIYFEAVDLFAHKESIRLDLTKEGVHVEKAKVGPLESIRFDSAVSISSSLESKKWVLEFVDLGGEMRRDVWHASISEIISLHRFIRDYGPQEGDESIFYVYGARKGEGRAINSSLNCIARLQALQFMRKIAEDPVKLVQFSYLNLVPYGHVVCQTLAVNFWGGPLVTKLVDAQPVRLRRNQMRENSNHLSDIDGSVYLRRWTKSRSWSSKDSIAFWKNFLPRDGVVLSKNLVVADMTLVAMAAEICKRKYEVVEKTQATINAATLTGIPSNIDLFKELVLPLTVTAKKFDKLRRWEEPHLTVSFLALAYAVIFRNLMSYLLPTVLIISAASMLSLKRLKEQGRLGRNFGKVTIRDQPPSNTIQKIIAVKDAMRDVESYLQNINVSLLKIRTVILSGQPQVTTEVSLAMLFGATVLLTVRFKYVLAFFIFDLFTRELEFRKEMVMKFMSLVKQRWDMVPAAPVVVLPFETDEPKLESPMPGKWIKEQAKLGKEQRTD